MANLLEYKFDVGAVEEYVKSLINVDNVETVIQFGSFVNNFTSGVSRSEYDRLMAHYNGPQTKTIEYIGRGGRHIVVERDEKLYSVDERILRRTDILELGVRIEVKTKQEYEIPDRPKEYITREKDILTQDMGKYQIRIVRSKQGKQTRYEVEISLEFDILSRLSEILDNVTKVMKGSDLVLSLQDVDHAYLVLNDALGGPECMGRICYAQIPQPRNIKTSDISHTGVIPVKGDANYYASPKADGINVFLVMDNGTYLVHSSIVNKVSESSPFKLVLHGELVGDTLYAFDVLKHDNKYLRDLSYADRLKEFDNIDLFQIPFNVKRKRTMEITRRNFYPVNAWMMRDNEFEVDGIIYTPNTQYNVDFSKPILKWKPPEQLTIDFIVKDGELHTYQGVFRGTAEYPYNPNFNRPDLNDAIGEFEFKDDKFHLVRLRPDKLFPNPLRVVEGIWKDIHEPITTSFMMGETFTIMLDYIRARKKLILSNVNKPIIVLGEDALGLTSYLEELEDKQIIQANGSGTHNAKIRGIEVNEFDADGVLSLSDSFPDAFFFIDTPAILPAALDVLKERGHEIAIFAVDGSSVLAARENSFIFEENNWWKMVLPELEGTGEIIDYAGVAQDLDMKSYTLDYDFLTVTERMVLDVFRIIR